MLNIRVIADRIYRARTHLDVKVTGQWSEQEDGEITIGDGTVYVQVGDDYISVNTQVTKDGEYVGCKMGPTRKQTVDAAFLGDLDKAILEVEQQAAAAKMHETISVPRHLLEVLIEATNEAARLRFEEATDGGHGPEQRAENELASQNYSVAAGMAEKIIEEAK